ncbi:MAG TPA: glutamine synthetase family protein [Bryobacteraceae bacterium]|nr:glutamine synthetase family protein [Bryobacteraceae bacterium]
MNEIDQIVAKLRDAGVHRVKLAATDIDGVLRGKYVSLDKFASAYNSLGFCDVIFGWDIGDVLYDNCRYTGWHTGYPDTQARIDLSSMRMIPWEPGTAFFLMDLLTQQGEPLVISPRQVLEGVLERAKQSGFSAKFAAEYEFWLFRETPHSLREKNFHHLTPLSPGMFGYSVLRASQNAPLVLDIIDQLAGFDVALEGFHTETGPGVYEAAICVDDALRAADKAVLFKTAVKEIAARHGVLPTFMAKWSADLPGSSGHLHQSLGCDGNNTNVFFENGAMSPLMRQYIAGLTAFIPELMVMIAPTVNSYKRTVPGTWAPINASWGTDNRTTAIRAIMGSAKSTRIELRLSAADMNPYLAMAASLAAGLEGIERKLDPPPPVVNGYEEKGCSSLPRDLGEATMQFHQSAIARKWFGDCFVEHFAGTREWELRQYRRAVTDWELARYFESV